MRNKIYELTKENKALKKQIETLKNKGLNEFIKVYSLNFEEQETIAEVTGSNKRSFVMSKYLGDIKDDDGIVLAEISTTLNGLNLLVKINGNIIGIDSTAVIEHIILNHLDYVTAEFDKQINGGTKND